MFDNGVQGFFGFFLGFIMWAIYKVIPNYGIALLIFTLLTRLLMFPMAIKQQKSSAKTTMLQPKITAINEKFKGDKEKIAEETQKVYSEAGVNPMAGCLPLLIQFPILMGLVDVIYRPLSHMLHLSKDLIAQLTGIASGLGVNIANKSMVQLDIIKQIKENPASFTTIGSDIIQKISSIDYGFLGMNLMETPNTSMFNIFAGQFNPVVLIPVLSGISALAMSFVSMKTMPQQEGQGGGSMKAMMLMSPIMSIWIAFTVPAGVGLYWIYSNIFAILQSLYMNHKYNPKEIAEKAKAEHEEFQKKQKAEEKAEREEARKMLKEGKLEEKDIEKALTPKELNRRKLTEARKRDADRYGEEYVEVTDDDLQ